MKKLLLGHTVDNRCQKRFSFVHLTMMRQILGLTVDTVKIKNYVSMWLAKFKNQEILVHIVYLLFQDIYQILIIWH